LTGYFLCFPEESPKPSSHLAHNFIYPIDAVFKFENELLWILFWSCLKRNNKIRRRWIVFSLFRPEREKEIKMSVLQVNTLLKGTIIFKNYQSCDTDTQGTGTWFT